MNNYYKVVAKCGHVGRGNYLPMTFAVIACSRKEAAAIGRNIPRVKHDRKYAIETCDQISKKEFQEINDRNRKNPYLHCKTRKQQRDKCPGLKAHIIHENKNNHLWYSRKEKVDKYNMLNKKNTEILNSISLEEKIYGI